jgi:peptidoglycan/xylan/chitin deacetylase (PgdA/CDA1 family)
MRLRGMDRLEKAIWRVEQWLFKPAVVLLYHRIAEEENDPWDLCVSPKHFAEHLEVLRKADCPVRPLSALCGGKKGSSKVAITFDDGYADNLYAAKPILEKYDAFATYFLATGYIGAGEEFWWDELDRLLEPKRLPQCLELETNNGIRRWELPENSERDVAEPRLHWRAWQSPPTRRHQIYYELYRWLFPQDVTSRSRYLELLRAWAGWDRTPRPSRRVMTWQEVNELTKGGQMKVGAHTVHHISLADVPVAVQREEIAASKQALEEHTGSLISVFSYPYGSRSNYTSETIGVVNELGLRRAYCNYVGRITARTDPYQMPRLFVGNWDGDEFARRLSLRF